MVPQVYMSMYKQQFASPHGAKKAQLRPTSAHRRNNPQPRPDFLFPRSLQPSYMSARTQSHLLPPADPGRPIFPPVTHLSFHTPVTTHPDICAKTAESGKTNHMLHVNSASPSADRLKTLQLNGSDVQPLKALKQQQRRMDYLKNVHPLSAQLPRKFAVGQLQARPQTSNLTADQRKVPRSQYLRPHSNSSLDYSGCYSCFHVVKPYQAGHYIIHPEFVSECLPHC